MSGELRLQDAPANRRRHAGTTLRLRTANTAPARNPLQTVGRVTQTALDRITTLVGDALRVPTVCCSLVDADGQLITSSYGLSAANALLVSYAFRAHMTASRRALVVSDGTRDPLVARNPAVRDGTVVACVGVPLRRADGRLAGTLLAMDQRPRCWSGLEVGLLDRLGTLIRDEVEMAAAWRQVLQAPVTVADLSVR